MLNFFKSTQLINKESAIRGREDPIFIPKNHHFNGRKIQPPWPQNHSRFVIAMGCFWGVERMFWNTKGVYVTSVGYAGGFTFNPTYEEVCSGSTGHSECVEIIYEPKILSFEKLLTLFFENHDPTQGMRQGNDYGSQYRSIVFFNDEIEKNKILSFKENYQRKLNMNSFGKITTEVKPLTKYYYAEEFHQQYLSKIPNGYCAMSGTGIKCN